MSISALFAKVIPWHPGVIIFGRCLFAMPMLLLFLLWKRSSLRLHSWKDHGILLVLSMFLATHWVTYYQSIQLSTVALAIACIWTYPIMSTFIEPFVDGHRIARADVLIAIVAFGGVLLMIDDFSWGSSSLLGALFGLISALTMSIRKICSKRFVKTYSGSVTMWYQLLWGALFLAPFVWIYPVDVSQQDIINLLILAFVATAVAHTLVLSSLHHLTARTAGVLSVIQVVYGVVLAYIVLTEIPSLRELIGCCVIITSVVMETLRQTKAGVL